MSIGRITSDSLKGMSDDEIYEELQQVFLDLVRINAAIESADIDFKASGKHSDITWYKKAKFASKRKGAEHQLLLLEKSRREKIKKRDDHISRQFVHFAEKMLPNDVFLSILDRSQQ